jgi:hypothetical protein
VVAAVAGIISYGHIRSVALSVGESDVAAALLPIGTDGLLVVAALAMLEDSRAGRVPRTSARFALGFGIAATIAGNIASAEPTWTARAVAAVPAISFLIAVEVLSRTGKPRSSTPTSDNALKSTESQDPAPTPTRGRANPRPKRTVADKVVAARLRHPTASQAEIARRAGVSLRSVARHDPGPAPDGHHNRTPTMTEVTP